MAAGALHQGNTMARITAGAQGELTAVAQLTTSAVTSVQLPMVVVQAQGTTKSVATTVLHPEEVRPPNEEWGYRMDQILPMLMKHSKHFED